MLQLQVVTSVISVEENLWFYTNVTQALLKAVSSAVYLPPDSHLWKTAVTFSSSQQAVDAAGDVLSAPYSDVFSMFTPVQICAEEPL